MSDSPNDEQPKPLPALARVKFALARRMLWLIARCTSLSGLYLVGQTFAICEWALDFRRRRRFHQRMREIFAEQYDRAASKAACQRYFVRTRCDKFYSLVFDLLPAEQVTRRIHFPRRRLFDTSLERGKGVYVALSHHGAQHISGMLMSMLGYRVAGVRDRHEGALRRYIQELFSDRLARIFYADSFPRELFRWFKGNGILGSALDVERQREAHHKRFPVTLFGETKEYLGGPMQIALRCRAAIHQGFIVSRPWYNYELLCSDPLTDPDASEDAPEVLQHVMQLYASNIEAHVRCYPDHISKI